MKGKLIIFSAPSGSGKTSIVKEIIKSDIPFGFSVSATSRGARKGEVHGKDYYYLSIKDFKNSIDKGHFLEWEEVYHGQYYGTLLSEVEDKRNQGLNIIFDVDVVGGVNIKKFYGDDAISIFVKPPSIEELKNRLQNRGTEDKESLQKRLDKAEYELTFENKFDVVVVNSKLEIAAEEIKNIIKVFLEKS